MALLLPLNFISGKNRYKKILSKRPPSCIISLDERPKFRNGKAGQCNAAWFVWEDDFSSDTQLIFASKGDLN